jgi:hypothetical protein
MTKKIIIGCFTFLAFASGVFPQAFVDKGFHPRSNAVGRAVTALTTDAALMFYNPASIGFLSSSNVFTSYTNLYPDIIDEQMNLVNAGAAYSLGSIGVIGLGVSQFSPTAWSEQIFVGSYATRMFMDELSLGASLKILRWSADAPKGDNAVPEPALSYTGMTFDIGATYLISEIMEENDLQVGASILNITQPSVASNGSSDAALPMEIHAGAAYISRKFNYTLLGGIIMTDGDLKISFGSEINALKTTVAGIESIFLIRFGGGRVTAKDSQGDYNAGFGLKIEKLTIDYSYSYQAFITQIGGISSVSLGYEF